MTGSVMTVTKKKWLRYKDYFILASLLALYLLRGRPEMQIFGAESFAILAIITGLAFKEKFIQGRFVFSCGIYIYAHPIQQIVIKQVTTHFWLGLILSTALSIIAKYLSYKYVEKPFLNRCNETKVLRAV